ncbi:uncharacterized protein K452DRAFT_314850 [Aplosporella prunicola CBS 121167]|uniref:Uncharacterized protein n=1 Tax=Aplosporella prunicola CBS 121167 TaxID=1176127 RepID=A0A6A6BV94_9PEZI|nr:uncharacterized protein K452DRAFT_314850 [Aplosporella prunicola CBS 121167]KAF2146601.1 hypothetical protein K452DRAFT_314850 [Aplosporella prunicola CBS 121167]
MEPSKETADGAAARASAESNVADTPAATGKKTTFGSKFKRHCKRFWWLDFLIFAAIVLVIILPVIYVGVKHKAQSEMNKATIEIGYQGISNPKSNSIHLRLNTTVESHTSYHPDLEAFNASLFLENTEPDIKPFGYITIPKTHVESNNKINIDQELPVTDMDQFFAYNKMVINSEEFRLAVRGKPKLKLGGLPKYKVNYNKVVTMKGLNKLAGFAITSAQVKLKPEPDGATLLGKVSIPNPSVLSIEMGNVTMDLSVNGTYIGYTLIPNLTLEPERDNEFDMRSYVNTTLVLGLVAKGYTDLMLPVDIVGNSSINSEGEHLTYYEAAIKENTLHTTLNLTEASGSSGLGS